MDGWRPRPRPAAVGVLALALALAAGCTVRLRPEPAPPSRPARPVVAATTTTAGPAVRGTTVAARAFTMTLSFPDDQVSPAGPGPLPLAMRSTGEWREGAVILLLVFPLLRARPACVHRVDLWLRLLRFEHPTRVPDLGAYPSKLTSLASARPSREVGLETLVDNRPRGTGELTRDKAWVHFDVTQLYRTWAKGGPFGGDRRTAPQLRWTAARGC
jgi:hypothetical protein